MKQSKRKSQSSRKEAIIHATIHCYSKYGVAGTTMSQVATQAKVDQPLIHYYFPTAQSLQREVFRSVLSSLQEASLKSFEPKPPTSLEALKRYAKAPFLWAQKEPLLSSIWIYFYYLASFNPVFKEMNTQIRETGRERILVMIYSGLEQGEFKLPKIMTARDLATQIQSIITGNALFGVTEGLTLDQMSELTEKTMGVLLIKN